MADETTKTGDQGQNNTSENSEKGEKNNENAEKEKQDMVPHGQYHAERERRKEAEARLKKLEDERTEAERKAEEEKGNFKKLYEQTQSEKKALEEQLAKTSETVKSFETRAAERIETMLKSVKSDTDKETIKKILEGKSLAETEMLLPTLVQKFGTPENINLGPKGAGGAQNKDDRENKASEASKSGNILGMIANAPRL